MMKKILIISNMYPSKQFPHYGVFVQHISEILRESGNVVDVVYMQKTVGSISKLLCYVKFYIKTIYQILTGDYDIVYPHYASHTALPVLFATYFKKITIITNVHGNDVVAETESDNKYYDLVKRLLKKSKYVVCPSEYFKEIIVRDYMIQEEKIIVYPSGGVDTSVFKKIDRNIALKHLGLNPDKLYIGYVSRIEEKKGWDIFLKVGSNLIRKNKRIQLVVVGDGAQIQDYENLVLQLKLSDNIIKFDLLPQSEIAYIYNILNVFVFPTYRKSESLGLVGIEAMSCGALTVLPDKYGPSSYGKDRYNCLQFESADENSLEKVVLNAILLDPNERRNIINNAIKTANRYKKENCKSVLINLFKTV